MNLFSLYLKYYSDNHEKSHQLVPIHRVCLSVPDGLRCRGYSAARAAVAVSDNVTGPYTYLRSGRVNPGILAQNVTEADLAYIDSTPYLEWLDEWNIKDL